MTAMQQIEAVEVSLGTDRRLGMQLKCPELSAGCDGNLCESCRGRGYRDGNAVCDVWKKSGHQCAGGGRCTKAAGTKVDRPAP